MSTPGPKNHTIDEDGTIILHSNHLGEVVEVHINKERRRFYGIKKDGSIIEDDSDCGNDFAQPVMLYNIHYYNETDTWVVGYKLKGKVGNQWKDGFKTAREAWLYREVLIAGDIAER